MTWQRATEIVIGRTYSWWDDGKDPWVARTVDRLGHMWTVSFLRPDNAIECLPCNRPEHMPYEQVADPVVVLAPMLVGELRPNDNGDKPTAVFVDGELVAVFTAGQQDRANAYAEHLKGGA